MKPSYSIYIIDDDQSSAQIIAASLRLRGHQVSEFTRVAFFFEKLRNEVPDVIMVDMVIPEMPGWQICRKIRSIPGLQNAKLLAFSGILDGPDIDKIKVDGFLEKPVTAEDVERALSRISC